MDKKKMMHYTDNIKNERECSNPKCRNKFLPKGIQTICDDCLKELAREMLK
jgi:hypothetical protein